MLAASGSSISVTIALARRPLRSASRTIVVAKFTASCAVRMKAPDPTFTSKTIAPAPPAIFFETIEAAMRPMLGTLPVRSRSAYSFLSAGTSRSLWAAIAQPMRSICAANAFGERSVRTPGIASSLSSVPPVWPSARPDNFATGTPQAATSGTATSEIVSPTPPLECLSTTIRSPEKLSTSPEAIIASVSAAISSSCMPRIVQAIASAATGASSTVPAT